MKTAMWTMATTGLLAICVTSCGGGKDYATEVCNRLQGCGAVSLESGACNKLSSCGTLSQMGMATVSQCITEVNSSLSAMSPASRSQADAAIDQCLAQAGQP
jgi:hypothetical protein